MTVEPETPEEPAEVDEDDPLFVPPPKGAGARLQAKAERIAGHLPTVEGADPARAEEDRRAHLRRRWVALVPDALGDPRIADLVGDDVRAALNRWAENPDRNLLLTGPVGVGKSHAAFAACRGPFGRGVDVVAVNVPRMLRNLRPGGGGVDVPRLIRADLLVLDDLGAENPTEFAGETLYGIVNDRWEAGRRMVVTTNLPPTADDGQPSLQAADPRVYSRLIDGVLPIRLTGPDRRRTRATPTEEPDARP